MLDQPTVVKNASGQRPVENIVASPISLRHGGVQPACTSRTEMFGAAAPLWSFLAEFGGPANLLDDDLFAVGRTTFVVETFPVLASIAFGWTLPDVRPTGRLPKYNPARRSTFAQSDWNHLCLHAANAMGAVGASALETWLLAAADSTAPRKRDQDCVDACLCLLVAIQALERRRCLMVGDVQSGYMVVPHGAQLEAELRARCTRIGRLPAEWVRVLEPRS